MDLPLSWERLLWSRRALLAPWERYALTDFRLVHVAGDRSDEVALQDVADVQLRPTTLDRVIGTSTLVVRTRNPRAQPMVLAHVRRGAQLAALVEIAAADPHLSWDEAGVRAALAWAPPAPGVGYRPAALSVVTLFLSIFAIAISLHGKTPVETYPADDAIAPSGVKKDEAAILRFMEVDVMPWARTALAPIKGSPDAITCETCHGLNASAVHWRMPAVAALPQPDVAARGWEIYSGGMDTQMRNAIYGYIADTDNQHKATRMREFVMPGMARLLHRPAYDFTRSYEFNRTRVAFGCYHCHKVT